MRPPARLIPRPTRRPAKGKAVRWIKHAANH